jgi:hypothetical protein
MAPSRHRQAAGMDARRHKAGRCGGASSHGGDALVPTLTNSPFEHRAVQLRLILKASDSAIR